MGDDVALEIVDGEGNWQYVNDTFADMCDRKRAWFVGKNLFEQFPELGDGWKATIRKVAETRETYVERSPRGLPHLPVRNPRWVWNVLLFPLNLHDGRDGVVLSARVIEKKPSI